jgi:glycerol-3-phosphate acyltransferase PlsY
MVIILTAILVAYLIGAIPFGLLIGRLYGNADIRKSGSGNIGATNVQRVLGFKAAIWVYLLDIGKGALVVVLAGLVPQTVMAYDTFAVTVGVAAILGHIFPVYIGFKGGKGVATAAGVLLVLLPVETGIAVGLFLIVLFMFKYVSVASMVAALSFPASVTIEQSLLGQDISRTYWLLTIAIGLMVPVTHYKNIQRLLAGNENRLELGRTKGGQDG